jgi:hypothetical protein
MLYKRDDDIWEMECDRCHMRLTEVIAGDMPKDGPSAMRYAWASGWVVTPTENICAGCSNVSK